MIWFLNGARVKLSRKLAKAAAGLAVFVAGLCVAAAAAPNYRLGTVERGDLQATVAASGTLNAVVLVDVGSVISGQIRELMADFNSTVKQGDVIARINPETYEARVVQATADVEVSRAAVDVQGAQIARSRADVEAARAALTTGNAQISHAQLAVDDAQHDYDRKRPLFERQVVSASDWDKVQNALQSAHVQLTAAQAQAQMQSAQLRSAEAGLAMAEAQVGSLAAQVRQREAALRQAQIDLDHTYIRAPVDGVVINRRVDRGQTVAASLQAPTLFTIAQDLSRMQVDAAVAEADIGRVAVGQKASFTVDAFPGRLFGGEVKQIRKAPQVIQNVVTYDVVVSAENPGQELLPGMTANLSVLVATRANVLKVPNAALRYRLPNQATDTAARRPGPGGGGAQPGLPGRVYVLDQAGQPAPVVLRVGISDGTMTEIIAGDLKEGQSVVVGGAAATAPRAPGGPRLF